MKQMSKALNPGEINLELIPVDWPLTPVDSNKAPYLSGWQRNPQTIEDIKNHIETGKCQGVGLIGGPVYNNPFGLVWVDVDGPTVYKLIAKLSNFDVIKALPPTLTIQSGREGRERKLYKVPKCDWKYFPRNKYAWYAEGDGEKLEILWKNHQGVLMGKHPETDGYFTKPEEDFRYVNDIPLLPEWLLRQIKSKNDKQGKPSETHSRVYGQNFAFNTTIGLEYEIKEAKRALWALPKEHVDDYDAWLTAGQVLHTIDDSLLNEWDEWSKQSDKWKPGICQGKWKSFSKEGGVGPGTLFHEAQKHGFQFSQDYKAMPVSDDSVDELSKFLTAVLNSEPEPDVNRLIKAEEQQRIDKKKEIKTRNKSEDEVCDGLIGLLRGNVLFDPSSNKFHWYEFKAPGLWSALREDEMKGRLWDELRKLKESLLPNGFGLKMVNNMYEALKHSLIQDEWNHNKNLILFTNGVYDLDTNEMGGFKKSYHISRSLPYEYDPQATCEPIIDWLKFTQFGDWERVQLLRAWMRAVLTSADDIQRFVEIVGPGKSGKSTFTNLCHALVGFDNATVSTLQRIESNRFELSKLPGKKLLLFNDVERYGGSVSNLKVLTGTDLANSEHKFKAEEQNFKFDGLIMLTANEQIQSTDPSSGLFRRRITIPFERPFTGSAKEQCVLINCDQHKTYGKFAEYLPGLVNWLLRMDVDEMREYLLETKKKVTYYKKYATSQQTRANAIMDWINQNLIWDPNAATYIGDSKPAPKEASTFYANVDTRLYPNYCEFARNNGVGAMARSRFEAVLLDALAHQLGLHVYKGPKRTVIIHNVRLRKGGLRAEEAIDDKFPSPLELSQDIEKYEEFYAGLYPNRNFRIENVKKSD
jgi:P4 family phage/plasmid primase-like protien